ncbi:MAG: DHA2 family efflux MFS transporter permease subunit [Acidobacteriaceae bacterium]
MTVNKEQPINPWLIALSVVLPTFMEVLDTSIASVALPYIAGSLSASTNEATWVLTSYLVANAIVLPVSGWCSQRFGRKRFLMTCIVIFTIASFACGASTSLAMILLARAVQGAGGGALQPISQAIMLESFPEEKRGQAMAVYGLGVVVAPILGPTLGGYLTDAYSWRWTFYINIPIGILALIMISRFVRDPDYIRDAKPGPLDGIGLGLLATWLGCLQIVLDKGQEDDWFGATWIRWATAILIVSFVAFIWRMLSEKRPLVNLRVFLHRNFALGCILIALFGGCIYGLITLLPLFYQEVMLYPAFNAGIAVSPRGLGAIVAMPIIGILTSKMDNRWLIGGGFLIFGICGIWFGEVNLAISPWSFIWAIVLSGFGSGMVFVPLSTTTVAGLSNQEMGNATGLYNLVRNVGGSIGISITNTLLARHSQLHQANLVQNLAPSGRMYQQQLNQGISQLGPKIGTAMAGAGALGRMYSSLNVQALLLSYVDDFRYLALASFGCLPVVFLLRKAVRQKGTVIHAE